LGVFDPDPQPHGSCRNIAIALIEEFRAHGLLVKGAIHLKSSVAMVSPRVLVYLFQFVTFLRSPRNGDLGT